MLSSFARIGIYIKGMKYTKKIKKFVKLMRRNAKFSLSNLTLIISLKIPVIIFVFDTFGFGFSSTFSFKDFNSLK